ncbi:hypothetical protein [Methylomicrobium lacus]|uniref:hypothetical protein n=1 Tax=Methylomicrobium lacus TaxID=136992 RepID=UPI0035A8A0A0
MTTEPKLLLENLHAFLVENGFVAYKNTHGFDLYCKNSEQSLKGNEFKTNSCD